MSRLADAFRRAAADVLRSDTTERPLVRDIVEVQETAEVPWDLSDSPTGADIVRISPTTQMRPAAIPQVRTRALLETSSISREEASALVARLYAPGSTELRPRAVLFSAACSESQSAPVSAAVAEALANETSGTVCLVEANLRSPSLQALFHATAQRGLSEVMLEGGDLRQALTSLASNLWLLPAGMRGDDALPGLNAEQLRPRFQELLAMFDYLVVDTAAASDHRDAAVIGALVDGVVIILSANATRREVARRTVANLNEAGARVLGAVLADRTFPIPEAVYRKL